MAPNAGGMEKPTDARPRRKPSENALSILLSVLWGVVPTADPPPRVILES